MRLSRRRLLAGALAPFLARPAHARPLAVEATSGPLYHAALRLAGDWASVRFRVPPDEDPAFWTPPLSQLVEIQRADLILLNGAGFAPWTGIVSLPRRSLVDTSRGFADRLIADEAAVTHSHGRGGAHTHGAVASFVWLDFSLAAAQARAVAGALEARAPAQAGPIRDRLAGLETGYAALDAAAQALGRRRAGEALLAAHPRWQYFARRTGLAIRSLALAPGAAPGPGDWALLDRLLAERPSRVLLTEAPLPAAAAERLAALGVAAVTFDTGAGWRGGPDLIELWRDALAALDAAFDRPRG